MTDITDVFKATVKTVKVRQKKAGDGSVSHDPLNLKSTTGKSKVQHNKGGDGEASNARFSSKAKDIVSIESHKLFIVIPVSNLGKMRGELVSMVTQSFHPISVTV